MNEDKNEIVKIMRPTEDLGLIGDKISEKVNKWDQKLKRCLSWYILAMLETSFLGNIVTGKWVSRLVRGVVRAGRGFQKLESNIESNFVLALLHRLGTIKITNYKLDYQLRTYLMEISHEAIYLK